MATASALGADAARLVGSNPTLGTMKLNILRAGAIILSKNNPENIAILYRRNRHDWSFPKGHLNKGENFFQAMKREIFEETGLRVKPLRKLPNLRYIKIKDKKPVFMKVYLVASLDDSAINPENKGDKVKWVKLNKVINQLTYDSLKRYFRKVLPIVKKYSYLLRRRA